VYKRQA